MKIGNPIPKLGRLLRRLKSNHTGFLKFQKHKAHDRFSLVKKFPETFANIPVENII